MNAPDREDGIFLEDDEQKLYYRKDTKIVSAAQFTIVKEDHTLGNLLRMQLLRDKDVRFAGYKMPHPLENLLEIKVQTTKESDPLDVMLKTVEDLVREVGTMEKRFNEAVEAVRRDHDDYHEDAHMMH